jgi:hypothetical protein
MRVTANISGCFANVTWRVTREFGEIPVRFIEGRAGKFVPLPDCLFLVPWFGANNMYGQPGGMVKPNLRNGVDTDNSNGV